MLKLSIKAKNIGLVCFCCFLCIFNLASCTHENTKHIEASTTVSNDTLIYNEPLAMVQLLLEGDAINIGQYYNTFRTTPTTLKIIDKTNERVVLFIESHLVQLGVGQSFLSFLKYDIVADTVVELCSFNDIGIDDYNIDLAPSLDDKELYNYQYEVKNDSLYISLNELIIYSIDSLKVLREEDFKERKYVKNVALN